MHTRQFLSYCYLAAALAGIAAYALVSADVAQDVLYDLVCLSAVAALVAGVALWRGDGVPRCWLSFTGGVALLAVGDAVWDARDLLGWRNSLPGYPDAFYLLGYPLLTLGFACCLWKAYRRGAGKRLFDGAIVSLTLWAVLWTPFFNSFRASAGRPFAARATLAIYPAWDLILLGLAVAFFLTHRLASRSTMLLVLATGFLLAADLLWADAPASLVAGGWLDRLYLLSYVLFGAAALHPSAVLDDTLTERPGAFHRLVVLGLPLLLVPTGIALEIGLGREPSTPDAVIISVLLLLLLVRLGTGINAAECDRREVLVQNQLVAERTEQLRQSYEEIVLRLGRAIEYHEGDTGAHVERVGAYAAEIASALGLGSKRADLLRLAAPLHDVGKIAVPLSVLLKRGSLASDELEQMRRHADSGHELLAGSDNELLELAAEIAWTHHERWDGTGYPRALSGEEIPLEGRIVAVADVFDALISDRPYRPRMSEAQAEAHLLAGSGRDFDPAVVEAFFRCRRTFAAAAA